MSWDVKLEKIKPASEPLLPDHGFINDKELRKILKQYIKSNVPKKFERQKLLNIAFKLKLITQKQYETAKPIKSKSKSYTKVIEQTPKKEIAINYNKYLSNKELAELIEHYIGNEFTISNKIKREDLLKYALYLNLITNQTAEFPRPTYYNNDQLIQYLESINAENIPNSRPELLELCLAELLELCLEHNLITKEESEAKSLRFDKAIKAAHNREPTLNCSLS